MKQGWEIKKLGEVCKIQTGKLDANAKVDDGVYPFFTCDAKPYRINTYAFDDEAILISGNGSLVGHINYYNGKFNAYQRTYVLTQFTSFHIPFLISYLKGFLRSYIIENKKGGCIPYITLPILHNFAIPCPPREEQERIVEELDCLSSVIEKKREQLRELDALAQSIFYTMFGDPNNCIYETRNLSDLSEHKLSYGSGASAVDFDGKIRYVRITDIKDDGELQGDKVSPNVFDDKYTLNDGDILFARSGATVGKTYQYRQKDGKAIYAGYLIRFIPNRNIVLPSYIFGYTKTNYYKAFISASAQVVAQPNINAQQYGALKVPIPPLTLQQEFADKIEAIEKQKALIKQSITQTEELFNARMDYYFN
jgi:type I restriction enzyme S subunit